VFTFAEDGKLYMWGDNSDGQLGVGTNVIQKVPALVKRLSKHVIVQISCGRKHTVALTGQSYDGTTNSHAFKVNYTSFSRFLQLKERCLRGEQMGKDSWDWVTDTPVGFRRSSKC
jgi:hypothetical protein